MLFLLSSMVHPATVILAAAIDPTEIEKIVEE
jgi:hypothetical protein